MVQILIHSLYEITCWGIGNSTLLTSLVDVRSIRSSCNNWCYWMLRWCRWTGRDAIVLWFRKWHTYWLRENKNQLIYADKQIKKSISIENAFTALVSISSLWIMVRWIRWSHTTRNLKCDEKKKFQHDSIASMNCVELQLYGWLNIPAFVSVLAFVEGPSVDAFRVH